MSWPKPFLSTVQTVVSSISFVLPKTFQRLFYTVPFWIFKKLVKRNGNDVWFRNSLAFDDIVFGHSDIDLTYYSENTLSFHEAKKVQETLSFLKIIFPHLGELALYDRERLMSFSQVANPIELSRDPILVGKINQMDSFKNVSTAHRQVFALNWFRNDFHKWRENFSSRKKKIFRFFEFLEIKPPVREPQNATELFDVLYNDCWESLNDSHFKELLERVMDLPLHSEEKEKSLNHFYSTYPELRLHFMGCFPQLWIGPSLVHQGYEDDIATFSLSSPTLKECFKEQINWEVWGLYGQWMREGGNLNFYVHIDVLLKLLDDIPGNWDSALKGLRLMKESDPTHNASFSHDEVHYASK